MFAGEPLPYTGERMVPEQAEDNTFWEHVFRYRFAAKHVSGKRVLDIACGEGYGTAALGLAGAANVIGVDIDEATCSHARRKYGVETRQGDAENIPLADADRDVVVSFETIEHVLHPERFAQECARVLSPGGLLIISTPNRTVYSLRGENPYHCRELDRSEFCGILDPYFEGITLYTQMLESVSPWSPLCFSAKEHVWSGWRGAGVLKRFIRRNMCPFLGPNPTLEARADPIGAILKTQYARGAFANPYAVHASHGDQEERATYFVAVATKRYEPDAGSNSRHTNL